jgi:ribonuclease VapC
VVLDSFAILALLQDEPSDRVVNGLFADARAGAAELALCDINLGEVVYRLSRSRSRGAAQEFLEVLPSLPLACIEADHALVLAAADLKVDHPMSFADCFAAALAIRLGAEVATGDPEFRQVESLVRVLWLER